MDSDTARMAIANDAIDDLCATLRERLSTSLIADALDAMGYRNQAMDPTIRPLYQGARVAGPALTIMNAPVSRIRDGESPYGRELEAIDALPPGSVAVVAMGPSIRACFWGELLSTAAIARGAAGAIVDGYVRDGAAIRKLGLPVFALGSWSVDSSGRSETTAYNCPIQCGGVMVHPGDIVLGDDDGTISIPRSAAQEAVGRALAKLEKEELTQRDLQRGLSLREVYRLHGTL